MKKNLSEQLNKITPSMTLSITAKAKEMMAEGIDVISFGAGEPDFFVDQRVKEAAIKAVTENRSKYTDVNGILPLRKAIAERLENKNHITYQPNEIIVTGGAKQALFTALQTLLSPGDEVLIPVPYWVSYSEMAKIAGGTIVPIYTKKENQFILQPDELKKAISSQSKVIMLNNPSNPTGAVYKKEELQAIADICLEEGIYILSDEIYDEFIYEDNHHYSVAALSDEIKNITITINGLSKTYAMPGWRVGYAAANSAIIKGMSTIQGHCVSHTSSISQYAAVEALRIEQGFVSDMLKEYDKRRRFVLEQIKKLPMLDYIEPQGAFYLFIDISKILGKYLEEKQINNSIQFCETLLNEYHVSMIPGIGFGTDDFVRMSYACSMEEIKTGLERFSEFITNIK